MSSAAASPVIPSTMRALVQTGWGEPSKVLKLDRIPTPTPSPHQLLIRVKASSINPVDWKTLGGSFRFLWGRKFPFVPLMDCSGLVVAKGEKCDNRLSVGDEVFGTLHMPSGGGGEFVVTTPNHLSLKPKSLSFEEAAAVPLAAITAYQGLVKYGQLSKGQRVVVLGASGGVGLFALQLAKALGAAEVVAVCSESNFELVKSNGADRVINYRKENYGEVLKGKNFDLIYDCVGGAEQWYSASAVLKNRGKFVTIVTDTTEPSGLMGTVSLVSKVIYRKIRSFLSPHHSYLNYFTVSAEYKDLEAISQLIKEGKVKVTIERIYEMEEFQDMIQRSMSHRAKGKLVYRISAGKQNNQ